MVVPLLMVLLALLILVVDWRVAGPSLTLNASMYYGEDMEILYSTTTTTTTSTTTTATTTTTTTTAENEPEEGSGADKANNEARRQETLT